MIRILLVVTGLLMSGPVSAAEIYRCETDDGVQYADSPCGDGCERITVQDNWIGAGSVNGAGVQSSPCSCNQSFRVCQRAP